MAEVDTAETFLGDTLVFSAPDGRIAVVIDAADSDKMDDPDVVFLYMPANPAKESVNVWRGVAQTTIKEGGLLVLSVDGSQSYALNIDEGRGFSAENLPEKMNVVLQDGLELIRSQYEADPDSKKSVSKRQSGFTDASLTDIQENIGGWPSAFFEPQDPSRIAGACSAGGTGSSSCNVSCPSLPVVGNTTCSVTCRDGFDACCQCIGPQAFCSCKRVLPPACI